MTNPLLLVHLSDIHFCKPRLGPRYDLDKDLRRLLEADAGIVSDHIAAKPDGILISGDIAFSGKKNEYDDARDWLDNRLCTSVGSDPASVWCVCGNHDIDQSLIKDRPSFEDPRAALRKCELEDLAKTFNRYLLEPDAFYAPQSAYNRFALELDCDSTFEKPVWTKDFALNDDSTLRLHGLNSALISDGNDDIDTGKMVLGRFQCQLETEPGVENLVMCHHPLDWLRDSDEVDEVLTPRCRIQLFGHKHKHRLTPVHDMLRIGAGAVHPSRAESGWEPRYNWLSIEIENNVDRMMHINVYPRLWSKEFQKFDADYNSTGGSDHKRFTFKLPPFKAKPKPATAGIVTPVSPATAIVPIVPLKDAADSRGSPIMDPERTLSRRFYTLPYTKKMKIATELELHADDDDELHSNERLRTQLQRAKSRGAEALAHLWDLVEQAHGDGRNPVNPYRT